MSDLLQIFSKFLYEKALNLSPSPDKTISQFIQEIEVCLDEFDGLFSDYTRFAHVNVKSFIADKRAELNSLKGRFDEEKCLSRFNFLFLTGGICVGKTTLIDRLIKDQAINKDGKRFYSIGEPTEYWYKNEERNFDDIIILAVIKDKAHAEGFPFTEFFIATWLFNILVNMVKASVQDKTVLIIERDFSDQYSLELKDLGKYHESYGVLEAMKKNFESYVILRFITKSPLLEVMKKNLKLRLTSEVEGLDKQDYKDFINNYQASFKSITSRMQLGSYPNVFVREYFVDQFLSETFEEIKLFILLIVAK